MSEFMVREAFTQGKRGDADLNEDALVRTPDFLGVIDGATAKTPMLFEGKTPGVVSRMLVLEAVEGLRRQAVIGELVDATCRLMQRHYQTYNMYDLTSHSEQRLNASVILLSQARQELWFIGDCQCLIDGEHDQMEKLIDTYMVELRRQLMSEYLRKYSVEEMRARDRTREDLEPFLRAQYAFQNAREESVLHHAVLDGFPVSEDAVRVVSVAGAKELVLASDGYPELKGSLRESEDRLAEIIAEDPLMYRLSPQVKGVGPGELSFDDRSYLRLLRE